MGLRSVSRSLTDNVGRWGMDCTERLTLKAAEVERLREALRLARLELEWLLREAQNKPVAVLKRVK